MTIYHGKNGVVKIGTDSVLQIVDFGVEQTYANDVRGTMGRQSTESAQGLYSWTGTITCIYDPIDAGQLAARVAGDLAFEGFPTGEAAGEKLSGNLQVETIGQPVTVDGQIEQSFTFTGNGDLTRAVIP